MYLWGTIWITPRHVISIEGIAINLEKVKTIVAMSLLMNLKGFQSFTSSVGYYQRFVKALVER